MGEKNLPASYIEYSIERFIPVNLNSQTVDVFTVVLFFAAIIVSTVWNIIDFRNCKKSPQV